MQFIGSQNPLDSESSSLAYWPPVLIAQHEQLDDEIQYISDLITKRECRLLQVESRLKKLIKGVFLHLELEESFISKVHQYSEMPSSQYTSLNQGYLALESACNETREYLHKMKLKGGSRLIEQEHATQIEHLLQRISTVLNDEDDIYVTLRAAV